MCAFIITLYAQRDKSDRQAETGNKTANMNIENNSLSTMLTPTDQKQQKSLKDYITQHHI